MLFSRGRQGVFRLGHPLVTRGNSTAALTVVDDLVVDDLVVVLGIVVPGAAGA
jgi:hypothetical protein